MKLLYYILITLSLFSSSLAYALPSTAVLPLVIDETLEGRDIVRRDITVTNNSTSPMTVYPTVNNISISEGGAIQEFVQQVQSDQTSSLAAWVEISRQGIDLQPGASHTFELTLRVHPEPKSGIYHAFIGFGHGSTRDDAERMVVAGIAPGTIVNVTIDDKKTSFLKLSNFFVERFVVKAHNEAAVFTFTNPGDEAVTPEGEIILYNSVGKEVGAIPLNPQNTSINPGEEHTFVSEVPIHGLFGKYKAFLTAEYGTTERASVQDTDFFYVFPIKTLLIVLGVLFSIIIIGAVYIHKKYFDESTTADDSERLTMHIREGLSDALHHDINLKNKS